MPSTTDNNNSSNKNPSSSSSSTTTSSFEMKAGMQGVDKEAIENVIEELTRGTPFHEHQLRKDAERDNRINKLFAKSCEYPSKLSASELTALKKSVDAEVDYIHKTAKVGRYVHVDMDAFHASVEELDQPHLKTVPMAVGSTAIIGTSNYPARKFGVRSGMPGFVAKHLCPQLVFVPPHFEKYKAATDKIRQVAKEFDPNFTAPFGGDELFLELSDENLKRRAIARRRKELQESSSKAKSSSSASSATAVGRPPCIKEEERAVDEFLFVQDLRQEIYNATQLTCSAGIGPTPALAKIVSNFNKPNGQFSLEARTIEEVKEYVWNNLNPRQIPGIGKVTEKTLTRLGIKSCRDIWTGRYRLKYIFPGKLFHFLLHASLGLTGCVPEKSNSNNNNNKKGGGSSSSILGSGDGEEDNDLNNNRNKSKAINASSNHNNSNDNNNTNNKAIVSSTKFVSVERTLEKKLTNRAEAEKMLNYLFNRALERLKETVTARITEDNEKMLNNYNTKNNKKLTLTELFDEHPTVTSVEIKNIALKTRLNNFDDKDVTRRPQNSSSQATELLFVVNEQFAKTEEEKETLKLIRKKNEATIKIFKKVFFDIAESFSASAGAVVTNSNSNSNNNTKEENAASTSSVDDLLFDNPSNFRLLGCRFGFEWPSFDRNGSFEGTHAKLSLTPQQQEQMKEERKADAMEKINETMSDLIQREMIKMQLRKQQQQISQNENQALSLVNKQKTLLVVQGQEMLMFVQRGLHSLPLAEREQFEIFEFKYDDMNQNNNPIFMSTTLTLENLLFPVVSAGQQQQQSSTQNNSNNNDVSNAPNPITMQSLRALFQRLGLRPKVDFSPGKKGISSPNLRTVNYKSVILCGSTEDSEAAAGFCGLLLGTFHLLWPSLLEAREKLSEVEAEREEKLLQMVSNKQQESVVEQEDVDSSTSTSTSTSSSSLINDRKASFIQVLQTTSSSYELQQQEQQQEVNNNKNNNKNITPRTLFLNLHDHIVSFYSPLREADLAALRNMIHVWNLRQRRQWLSSSSSHLTTTTVSKQSSSSSVVEQLEMKSEYCSASPSGARWMRTIKNFVDHDVKLSALGECQDMIPHVIDGLTRPQRIVLHGLMKLHSRDEAQRADFSRALDEAATALAAEREEKLKMEKPVMVKGHLTANQKLLSETAAKVEAETAIERMKEQIAKCRQELSGDYKISESEYHYTLDEIVDFVLLNSHQHQQSSSSSYLTRQKIAGAVWTLTSLNFDANLPLLISHQMADVFATSRNTNNSNNNLLLRQDQQFYISPVLPILFPKEDFINNINIDQQQQQQQQLIPSSPAIIPPLIPLILINNNDFNTKVDARKTVFVGKSDQQQQSQQQQSADTLSTTSSTLTSSTSSLQVFDPTTNHIFSHINKTSPFAGSFACHVPRFHPLDVFNRAFAFNKYGIKGKSGKRPDPTNDTKRIWYRMIDPDPHFPRKDVAARLMVELTYDQLEQEQKFVIPTTHNSNQQELSSSSSSSPQQHHHNFKHNRYLDPPLICVRSQQLFDKHLQTPAMAHYARVDDIFRAHQAARISFYKTRFVQKLSQLKCQIELEENMYRFCSAVSRSMMKVHTLKGEEGLIDFLETFGYQKSTTITEKFQKDNINNIILDVVGGDETTNLAASAASSATENESATSKNSTTAAAIHNNSNRLVVKSITERKRGYEYLLNLPPSKFTEFALKDFWQRIQDMKAEIAKLENILSTTTNSEEMAKNHLHMQHRDDLEKLQKVLVDFFQNERELESRIATNSPAIQTMMQRRSNSIVGFGKTKGEKKNNSSSSSSNNNIASVREKIAARIHEENEERVLKSSSINKKETDDLSSQSFSSSFANKHHNKKLNAEQQQQQQGISLDDENNNTLQFEDGEFDGSWREQKRLFMKQLDKGERRKALARRGEEEDYEYDEYEETSAAASPTSSSSGKFALDDDNNDNNNNDELSSAGNPEEDDAALEDEVFEESDEIDEKDLLEQEEASDEVISEPKSTSKKKVSSSTKKKMVMLMQRENSVVNNTTMSLLMLFLSTPSLSKLDILHKFYFNNNHNNCHHTTKIKSNLLQFSFSKYNSILQQRQSFSINNISKNVSESFACCMLYCRKKLKFGRFFLF